MMIMAMSEMNGNMAMEGEFDARAVAATAAAAAKSFCVREKARLVRSNTSYWDDSHHADSRVRCWWLAGRLGLLKV